MPAVRGYAYRDHAGVELSPLYNRDEPTYASYWQNRDPRMAMTILEPGSEWVGGNDGTPGDNVTATPVFQLPRFASLKNNNRNGANSMRSEEHTSELQSLMRISYAVFCLKKTNRKTKQKKHQSL